MAKGIALTELHEMKGYLKKCKEGLYYGAYKPIWRAEKQKWIYGECARDWGDSHHTATVLCPEYVHAEAEYQSASGEEKASLKAKRDSWFARCNNTAMATGDMSRMYVGTGEVCIERCELAAGEMWDCRTAMRIVNTSGIPTINKLENKVGSSSSTSEEIMNAHLSFINMYRICGREKLLKELSLLRPHFQNSTNFSKLMKKSNSVAKKHGGDADTEENKKGTKKDRLTIIHSVDDYKDVKNDNNMLGREKLSISDEYLKNEFNPTKKGEATPMCSDLVASGCGEYSKRLINSLISCSESINSTIDESKMAKNLMDKFFKRYRRLFISEAHAASLTKKIADSIGIGGKLLNSLNNRHVNLINKYDPLLSTYNKRILLHEIAENIMLQAIRVTKESLENIDDRLKSIAEIKQTFSGMKENNNISADVPYVPDVEKAKGVSGDQPNALYKQLWGSCGKNNCSNGNLINISKNSIAKDKSLVEADNNIVDGALAISTIGKDLRKQQMMTSKIKNKLINLGSNRDIYNEANNILKKYVNKAIEKNEGQEINFKNISMIANKYAKKIMKINNDRIKDMKSSLKLTKNKYKNNNYVSGKDQDKYYTTGKANNENFKIAKKEKISLKKLPTEKNINIKRAKDQPYELIKFSDIAKNINIDIVSSPEVSIWEIINIRYRKHFLRKNNIQEEL